MFVEYRRQTGSSGDAQENDVVSEENARKGQDYGLPDSVGGDGVAFMA